MAQGESTGDAQVFYLVRLLQRIATGFDTSSDTRCCILNQNADNSAWEKTIPIFGTPGQNAGEAGRHGVQIETRLVLMSAMIGIIAAPGEESVVREFFELFKTPWEYYRSGREYDVVVCAGDSTPDDIAAKLLIVYSDRRTGFDAKRQVEIQSRKDRVVSFYAGSRLHIFGGCVVFRHTGAALLVDAESRESIAYLNRSSEQMFARMGYNLFREVRTLLMGEQPPDESRSPALELHIAILRDLVVSCGFPLVEIPPAPEGYPFVVCLTHDVDHPSIRRHRLDHTALGFLYRALVASAINFFGGRLAFSKLLMNWFAAAKLPFVYLGIAGDFWSYFERYLDIDRRPSTFFVIPFSDRPGITRNGTAPSRRATRYDVTDIAAKIQALISAGCEVGLHGIDAWADTGRACEEARRISEASAQEEIGVRMHWLYRDAESLRTLDVAGFLYDSTIGYNEAVGFRAGTTQVFKPLTASRILELPLHIMDTALFYPGRMNLSPAAAWEGILPVLEGVTRYAGVLTINWHDRSIAPERLWGDFYCRVLDWLEDHKPWFSTAAQAVRWFQRRRSATFESVERHEGSIRIRVCVPPDGGLPPLRLRIHEPVEAALAVSGISAHYGHRDVPLNSDEEITIPLLRDRLKACR